MNIPRDEKVINALVTILESEVGYQINLDAGLLQLYKLHDLRFAVNRYERTTENPSKDIWIFEELFDDAREAVEFFEQKRREFELGDDIEGALMREDKFDQTR